MRSLFLFLALTFNAYAQPNFIFVTIDDMSAEALGSFGGYATSTPNIDKLAAQGVSFKNAYAAVPVCKPSRVATLFGITPEKFGGYTNDSRANWQTNPALAGRDSFLKKLNDSGYQTFGAGKIFHSAHINPNIDADFQWTASYYPHDGYIQPNKLTEFGVGDYALEDHADFKVSQFLIDQINNRDKSKPFIAAAGYISTHQAYQPHKSFYDLYLNDAVVDYYDRGAEDVSDMPASAQETINSHYSHWRLNTFVSAGSYRNMVRAYMASVSQVDAAVGKLLDAVKDIPDTYIVLWSDNGQYLGEKGLLTKFFPYQEAARVPIIFAGVDVLKGWATISPVSAIDIAPTIAALAGIQADFDGFDLTYNIKTNAYKSLPPVKTLFEAESGPHTGEVVTRITDKRFTLIEWPDGVELYDMVNDPKLTRNIASSYPGWVATLNIVDHQN